MSQLRTIRTVSAAVLLAGAVSFSVAGPAAAQNQFNCKDFTTQQQAQAELDKTPGRDPNRLDANHNGKACEDLPRAATSNNPSTPSSQGANSSQGAASNQVPSGNNGSAGGQNGVDHGQVTTVPKGAVQTGDGSTSNSNSMTFILGGLALIAVGGGVGVAARRRTRLGV